MIGHEAADAIFLLLAKKKSEEEEIHDAEQ